MVFPILLIFLPQRDDTFGVWSRLGYGIDPEGRGELNLMKKIGLRYKIGGNKTYDSGKPIWLIHASSKYLQDKTRPITMTLTSSALIDTAWYVPCYIYMYS